MKTTNHPKQENEISVSRTKYMYFMHPETKRMFEVTELIELQKKLMEVEFLYALDALCQEPEYRFGKVRIYLNKKDLFKCPIFWIASVEDFPNELKLYALLRGKSPEI